MITLQHYYFRDKWTNEVFQVDSSFCIWEQALYRSPKFILAKLEYGMGYGEKPEDRFEQVNEELVNANPI